MKCLTIKEAITQGVKMSFNLDLGKISDYYTREVFKQVVNSLAEIEKKLSKVPTQGAVGPRGPAGESFVNIDGGTPVSSNYGDEEIDGGGVA